MGNEDITQHVAANIARLRAERGWSAAELARRAGVDPGTIGNVEAGGNATIVTLAAIADAFDLPLAAVIFRGQLALHEPVQLLPAERQQPVDLGSRLVTALASVPRARDLRLSLVRFRDGEEHHTPGDGPATVERLFLLEGQLEVAPIGDTAAEPVPLGPGDLATVQAAHPRRYRAVGGEAAALVVTSVEPPV